MLTFKQISSFAAALSLCFVVGCAATDDDVTIGEAIDDTVITAKVKAALIDDKELSAIDIKVETREGVVQLSGFVDDRSDIVKAGAVTSDIEGVRSVRNDLVLK